MDENKCYAIAKKFYADGINELVQNCDDISLLDLIFQLLVKESK